MSESFFCSCVVASAWAPLAAPDNSTADAACAEADSEEHKEGNVADVQEKADNKANDKSKKITENTAASFATFSRHSYSCDDRHIKDKIKGPPDRTQQNFEYNHADYLSPGLLWLISWLNSIIHHLNSTALQQAKVVIFRGGTRSTGPAKLIATEATSHVITALILLNFGTAHRTE